MKPEERAEFEENGIVRLPRAVDPALADALRRRTLAHLDARKLVPTDPAPSFNVTPSKTAAVANALGFRDVWTERVVGALDDILGAGAWHVPTHAGQLLAISFPQCGATWTLPHQSWHLDYRAPGAIPRIPGVQIFLCVDDVAPHGGATLALAGSSRLIDAIRRREGPAWDGSSAAVRRALKAEVPWIRDLVTLRPDQDRIADFMSRPTLQDGVALQVVALSGAAGDVHVMHPWTLHVASPNCGDRPRMVLTERIRARLRSAAGTESANPDA
jgi:hypothetical protein